MKMIKEKNLSKSNFDDAALLIKKKHFQQTVSDIKNLKIKYQKPIFGFVPIWQLVEKLNFCIDPTDKILYKTNQMIHLSQVIHSMEKDGLKDELLYVIAILHDLGKLLLLTNEDPANIVCDNDVVGNYPSGIGLDNCVNNWNHDEIAYERLKNFLPKNMAWLIRYHSINIKRNQNFMNDDDKNLCESLLIPFSKHDKLSKSHNLPLIDWDKYRKLCEKHLPDRIIF